MDCIATRDEKLTYFVPTVPYGFRLNGLSLLSLMSNPQQRKARRVQRKISQILQEVEQRFRVTFLVNSEQEIEDHLLPHLQRHFLRFCQSACFACNCSDHKVWVRLFCGGCNLQWWVHQRHLSEGFWCQSCSFHWHRETAQGALVQLTGKNIIDSLQLVENLEDLRLRELAWSVQHLAKKILADSYSVVLQSSCQLNIGVPIQWQVEPRKWDHVCRRFKHRAANRRLSNGSQPSLPS